MLRLSSLPALFSLGALLLCESQTCVLAQDTPPGIWHTPQQKVASVTTIQPLTGIDMELPLNEGTGTVAHDISGNGNDATFCTTGAVPIWTSQGLAFAEAPGSYYGNACLDTPLTTWTSLFVELCPYAGAQPNSILDPNANPFSVNAIWGSTTETDGIDFTGSAYDNVLFGMNPTLRYLPLDINAGPTYSSAIYGECHVLTAVLGSASAGTLDTLTVDGVPVPYLAQGASAELAPTVGHYQLGCIDACLYWSNYQAHFQGVMVYAVASRQAYTAQQTQSEVDYILNMTASRHLNQYPPGTGTANTIIAVGDSLTAGFLGTTPGWYQLLQTNETYQTISLGIIGMWAEDMAAMWPQRENQWFSPYPAKQYCHIWGGTNDITFDNIPIADVWAALVTLGQECKAVGGIPIVATMISRQYVDAQKDELNAVIRANWQSAGFATIDDIAGNYPQLGADGAYLNSTYFQPDGVHLTGPNGLCDTTSGYGIVCVAVSNTVNALDKAEAQHRQLHRMPRPTEGHDF